MLLVIPRALRAKQVEEPRHALSEIDWIDGRATATILRESADV
jgi:predicted 2-oxoglutarate/Fe(II)-dependent dioxygenase YbiX